MLVAPLGAAPAPGPAGGAAGGATAGAAAGGGVGGAPLGAPPASAPSLGRRLWRSLLGLRSRWRRRPRRSSTERRGPTLLRRGARCGARRSVPSGSSVGPRLLRAPPRGRRNGGVLILRLILLVLPPPSIPFPALLPAGGFRRSHSEALAHPTQCVLGVGAAGVVRRGPYGVAPGKVTDAAHRQEVEPGRLSVEEHLRQNRHGIVARRIRLVQHRRLDVLQLARDAHVLQDRVRHLRAIRN
jgi:hypothetical protein